MIGWRTCERLTVRTRLSDFVEARAGGIGRQIEEAEHARQRGVEIRDPVIEAQRQYRQRQRRLPMLHQPDLLADHPAEIGEIVGVAVRAVESGR